MKRIDLQFIDLKNSNSKSQIVSETKLDQIHLYLWKADDSIHFDFPVDRIYLPYEEVLKGYRVDGIKIVPVIPNITKGWHDDNIRKNFNKIVDAAKDSGISIGNLGWIEQFVSAGLDVYGDYGLNLYNSKDFLTAKELGLKEAMISHEASIEDISKMDFHGVIPEVVITGRIPVMTSEHCVIGDLGFCSKCRNIKKEKNSDKDTMVSCAKNQYYLKDRKGEYFPFLLNPKTCRNIIFSYKTYDNWNEREKFKGFGVNNFRIYGGLE